MLVGCASLIWAVQCVDHSMSWTRYSLFDRQERIYITF